MHFVESLGMHPGHGTVHMREITATVTERGQVTIPVEVRRLLGIKPRDKVSFAIENGQVRLVPAGYTLESAYGSVKPIARPEDFAAISKAAIEEHVEKTVRKMGQR